MPGIRLFYYKARMYSPTLGRFMQTDPIGYEDQINLHAYVANDPVNGVDPDGKQDQKLDRMNEQVARRISDEAQTDREKYNAGDPNGADNVLSLSEANRHARYGDGKPVTVDASKLTVEVYSDQESKIVNGRYGAEVQGAGKLVYGGVSVDYDPNTGKASIISERYDFEQRRASSIAGVVRNIKTSIGKAIATNLGRDEITSYTIHFSGQPQVIFVD